MSKLTRSPVGEQRWRTFDDPFENLFQGVFRPMRSLGEENDQELVPAMDVAEHDHEYVVKAELPGVKKDDIEVILQNGLLTISAESRQESEAKEKGRIIRQERRYGQYVRNLRLDTEIDENNVKASYKDGMLELILPKAEAVRPKRIAVDVR